MTARQPWSVVLGVIALLGVALWAATYFLGDELFPIVVGSEAPEISAATVVGPKRTKTLVDYKNRVVVLNVWATWCEPCRVEMPSLQKLHDEFGPQGLAVVGLSVDDAGTESHILEFVKEYKLGFEILHDPTGTTKANYQVTGFPETFVIARDGTIRKKVIGAADWSSEGNRALVRELLDTTTARR